MGGRGRGRGRGRGQQQKKNEEIPAFGRLQIDNTSPVQAGRGQVGGGMSKGSPASSTSSAATTPRDSQSSTPAGQSSSTASSQASTPSSTTSALAKFKYPARTGLGTRGTPMDVVTNHFEIMVKNKQMDITEYDVDIKLISEKDNTLKDCPKKYLKRGMYAFGEKVWPNRHPAFDGSKLLFSCGPKLINGPMTAEVAVRNEDRFDQHGQAENAKLRITVKEVNKVSLSEIGDFMRNKNTVQFPQLAIQAIDVVLRNSGMTGFLQVGRSFFYPPKNPKSLGGGMDLWYGVFQSATLGTGKVFLNVDVAHKGFPRAQWVRDLVADLGTPPPRYNQPPPPRFNPETEYQYGTKRFLDEQLCNFLKGLKVEYEIPNIANSKRVYRVNNVVPGPHEHRFTHEDEKGQKKVMTVAEYFAIERRYRIRFPNWPCLHVGSRDRNILVPMELCRVVPNQATVKKLNEEQTRVMVREAATKPNIRKAKILDAFNSLRLGQDACLQEFGINVQAAMTQVKGRVLPPPALKYRSEQQVRVRNGEWNMDREKFQVVTGAVQNWVIVDLCGADRDIQNLTKQLGMTGASLGMTFDERPKIIRSERRLNSIRDLTQFLENKAREGPFDLAVVLIPDYISGQSPYPVVKQVLELKWKMLTQCIRQRTLRKLDKSTVTNILLKINSKLDGKNHSLHRDSRPACFNQNVMIMGADVTHPPPDSKTCPSVAAVTASHDKEDVFKFNMQWRLQPPKVEEILDMENITLAHLKYFASKNVGKFPNRIIFFRDGVSDGQFAMVLRSELSAIRKACRTIGQTYLPQITFLVVQKRHHTRFFPNQGDKLADRNGNVPAGFVVDNTITHPRDMDFYLVSHQSIQGTSRPTKYKVLYDDANMTADEVEQLTFYLCHLYTRCNRSVSYPAPTYYAHLAAFRAKHYYNEGRSTVDINNEAALNRESVKLNETMQQFIQKHPMFFV
ncbi:Hypothetical predicted protein [Cloeon dipterum]|uniref:Piwi domain-containing protein n=1 Tax=Cloeon dipterum TaxID=197152 RepID=A0A8S1DTX7_9INSE|nr:Hypothetical predicted protein [Cloeon dipterum]